MSQAACILEGIRGILHQSAGSKTNALSLTDCKVPHFQKNDFHTGKSVDAKSMTKLKFSPKCTTSRTVLVLQCCRQSIMRKMACDPEHAPIKLMVAISALGSVSNNAIHLAERIEETLSKTKGWDLVVSILSPRANFLLGFLGLSNVIHLLSVGLQSPDDMKAKIDFTGVVVVLLCCVCTG